MPSPSYPAYFIKAVCLAAVKDDLIPSPADHCNQSTGLPAPEIVSAPRTMQSAALAAAPMIPAAGQQTAQAGPPGNPRTACYAPPAQPSSIQQVSLAQGPQLTSALNIALGLPIYAKLPCNFCK